MNQERKETFERNRKQRNKLREIQDRQRIATDMQNNLAHSRIANAEIASVALQRLQSEQLGIIVNLFAQRHNLLQKQPVIEITPVIPTEHLLVYPALFQDGNTAAQAPDTVTQSRSLSNYASDPNPTSNDVEA